MNSSRYGTLCIRENPGCLFIATNRDAVGHMTELQEWPGLSLVTLQINVHSYTWSGWLTTLLLVFTGAGCMVAAICGSTQKEPIVVGKPSTFMMDFLLQK